MLSGILGKYCAGTGANLSTPAGPRSWRPAAACARSAGFNATAQCSSSFLWAPDSSRCVALVLQGAARLLLASDGGLPNSSPLAYVRVATTRCCGWQRHQGACSQFCAHGLLSSAGTAGQPVSAPPPLLRHSWHAFHLVEQRAGGGRPAEAARSHV